MVIYGHIYHNIERPDASLLAQFEGVPTATLSDAMGRHGAVSSDIAPIFHNVHMVGSALTVLCFPGDNLMTHKALQMVQPGDVLVVDDGNHGTGCFGFKSAIHVRDKGGVGIVVSGSIRDAAELRQERIPVFAKGISPRAPQKNTPGSINVPIQIGGIVVYPGDIIVGDDDGVVVIPLPMAEAVLKKALERDHHEKANSDESPGELPLDPAGKELSLDALLEGKVIEHHDPAPWRNKTRDYNPD